MSTQKSVTVRRAAIFCTATVALGIGSSTLAANWCEGRVGDTDSRIVERLAKPAPLQSYVDPAFGTVVTRVTDAPRGTARRTLYNTMQPWNADESLLILYHVGGNDAGHHLYDGNTFRYIRQLDFAPGDIEGIYWDPVDTDTLFFIQRRPKDDPMVGNLVRYNIQNRTRTQVADLNAVCGDPANRGGERFATGGNDIQGLGGDLIGLRCQNNVINNNSSDITFTVNIRNGRISDRIVLDPSRPQGSNQFGFSPSISAAAFPSGQRILVQNTIYDQNMNYLYRLDSTYDRYRARNGGTYQVPKPEHSTTGRMPDGNDALFTPQYNPTELGCGADSDFGRGAIVAYDIPAERCSVIVGRSTGWNYPLSGVHLSAVSANNPGWVSMSTIGYGLFQYFSNRQPAPVFFSELSLSHANPDEPTTCRLAHTRTYGKSAQQAGPYKTAYFGEPHPVMSPSGSRILFNSDWYDSGSVDTYAVTLQESQTENVPETPSPPPAAPEVPTPPPANDNPVQGYVFSRTDKQELRWISKNSRGQTGSIWISQACAAKMGGIRKTGDWSELMATAPALDTVLNPCQLPTIPRSSGYVYSRTDKNELRWITANSSGEQGSIWISSACAQRLGGVSQRGDWFDLMTRAPALDSVDSPCL